MAVCDASVITNHSLIDGLFGVLQATNKLDRLHAWKSRRQIQGIHVALEREAGYRGIVTK